MARELRIVIDLRPLALEQVGGVGLVVAQILEELSGRGVAFVGVADRPVPPGRMDPTVPVAVGGAPRRRIRWEAITLPGLLRRLDPAPDLYHATWNQGVPAGLPFPSILTIHDLIPWKAPRVVPWPRPAPLHQLLYRRAVRRSARAAASILAVSESTRRDIAALLPGVAARVRVVPNPLPRRFAAARDADGAPYRERFGGKPYWLYVGGFDPRKGLVVLLEAIARLETHGHTPPDLVLAGARNEESARCEALAARRGLRVHFPGHVPDAELPALYAGASLFVYPSLHEGFGIPVLLALAAGVPCLTTDGPAMREVAGDAAAYVTPGRPDALADALARALTDPAPFAAAAARGLVRARDFSVEAWAERMIRAYEEAAGSRPGSG